MPRSPDSPPPAHPRRAVATTLVAFVAATTVAGAAAGALLGALGGGVGSDVRAGLATLAALGGVVLGITQLRGGRVTLLQCDRETPKAWLDRGSIGWAGRNGLALGCGATTRLGFVLWYAVPVGAFLAGGPLAGALVYGAYGFARGVGAWAILAASRRRGFEEVAVALERRRPAAHRATALCLLATGVAIAIGIGA